MNDKPPDLSKRAQGHIYAGPMGVWLTIFFVAPLLIILVYSFLKKALYGGVELRFSLVAYRLLFKTAYLKIFIRTLWISALSTALCILIALPAGFAIARSRHQTAWLFLVIIPFWTNSLIRIFSWISLLGSEGIVHSILTRFGFPEDASLLYNSGAIVLVSVYMYLPYAILPIFTAIDKFDFSLFEAARDLGASKLKTIILVLLPNIKGGIITSLVFVFIPIFGSYTIPLMVGGLDSYMIGNVIADQITKTRNLPLAASFSVLLTLISAIAVLAVSVKPKSKSGGRR